MRRILLSVVLTISFIGVAKSQATTASKDREVRNETSSLERRWPLRFDRFLPAHSAFVGEGGRLGLLAWRTA